MALIHVQFFSNVLRQCMQLEVILPHLKTDTHGAAPVRTKPYPTLYLLHGLSDDQTIWTRRTCIESYAQDAGIAVVMPSTGRFWYSDCPAGNYFTYVAREVPQICRQFFPNMSVRREDTFVAGLSMGGYGAWKLALSCPETFSAAASLSGALDLERARSICEIRELLGHDVPGSRDDLFYLADQLLQSGKTLPRLFQWCGTEDFLYADNLRVRDHFQNAGFDLTYTESPGNHSWGYWDEHIQDALKWMGF